MKANTPQLKTKHNEVSKYDMRIRNSMTHGTAGIVGTITMQKPESEKTDPDIGLRAPQPQTSAKATLRFDEAGRSQLTLVIGSSPYYISTINFRINKYCIANQ